MSSQASEFKNKDECIAHLTTLHAENVISPKKTIARFLLGELLAFGAQFLVFFLALLISTNFLRDADKLARAALDKLGNDAMLDVGILCLAILAVAGLLAIFQQGSGSKFDFIGEFALEIPRAVYAFAASSSATIFVLEIYLAKHPSDSAGITTSQLVALGTAFVILGFIYGAGLSYAFKRHDLK